MMADRFSEQLRFLTLNTRSAWERGLFDQNLMQVTEEGAVELKQTTRYTTALSISPEELGGQFEVTDFAVGRCSLLYMLNAAKGELWRYDPNQPRRDRRLEQILEVSGNVVKSTTSITASPGRLYLASVYGEQRLTALSDLDWQPRWTIQATADFFPIDLATDENGNVYALSPLRLEGDTVPADAQNGVQLKVVKYCAHDQKTRDLGPIKLHTIEQPISIMQLTQRVALVIGTGHLYILDRVGRLIVSLSLRGGDTTPEPQSESLFRTNDVEALIEPSGFALVRAAGGDTLFIGDRRIVSRAGTDDRFIHTFRVQEMSQNAVSGSRWNDETSVDNLSKSGYVSDVVTEYRGAVEALVVDQSNRIYIYDRETHAIKVLEAQPTYLANATTGLPAASYFSPILDSTLANTRWHKLILKADIPINTQIKLSVLTADEPDLLLNELENPLMDADLVKLKRLMWSAPIVVKHLDTPLDALIPAAPGRYLRLRAELIGNERSTPQLFDIQVFFERRSYLRYLPAVYQEDDAQNNNFLERFLALFETFFSDVEQQIDHIGRYFDTGILQSDFLRWLASWLAVAIDANWDDDQLREVMKHAPKLFGKRGTRQGMVEIVELFSPRPPYIVEHAAWHAVKAGSFDTSLYSTDPYSFSVLVPSPPEGIVQSVREMLTRILDAETPAYTRSRLVVLDPWIILDGHTYLGVNTYLATPSPRLDSGASIPADAVLRDIDEAVTGRLL